ncbi:MAG: PIN domain-containing protein [Cyclobacteriaceae bacterium]|nr:PIN domain-containing protein [Cyclobacteriaceae bacterium]UYN87332.1 MAG: PIN domain-containing protein [Cyclobacteriaceae bacterium]
MNVFLDANILVSVLNKEYPLFVHSARIVSLAGTTRFKIFTSPLCLAIGYYFAEKKSGANLAKQKIKLLTQRINISTIDEEVVLQAAGDKAIHDFEDGIEYYAAKKSKCTCLVTEDAKDFYFSKIKVLTAEQFVQHYLL